VTRSAVGAIMVLLAAALANAQGPYPPQSIYHLDAQLIDQSGKRHGLDLYRGHPVLITLFYGRCPMACPMLIDTVRAVERAADPQQRANLRVLLVSIDPEHDTPQALRTLAETRRIDLLRWTLAQADEATVRKLAAVLNVQYRRLPDGQYNHASVISVLSPEGEIRQQSSVLGRADERLLATLRQGAGLPSGTPVK
jgi:protein SCO1/2